ncbi:MAG: acetyl-CoA carboxylase biotin carboxyl carrier protein [Aliidongia sp.]|jgi:acetyl-CoA carboxylase biotin carboxyl carrier protein|nr:acetyl-CoA carboxylase biotin carboxyl carrier protein [Aliidongia sp.]
MGKLTDIDGELVKKLAGLLDETRLTEIEYAVGEFRLRVTRTPSVVQSYAAAPAAAPAGVTALAVEADPADHPGAVTSPMVGTVYLSPQPGSAPFVRVGDAVSAGQILLIIEAMKVMNQIKAPKSGKVARILASDSTPVEFGQVVMILE